MSYIGKSPSQGVRQRYYFTATGGETSLSGADDNGAILVFTDGAYVDVYLNGVLLVAGTDYNTTTTNTIGGLAALAASDIVEIIVYDVFTLPDAVKASTGGTFNANVNWTDNAKATFGTGSDLQIYHNGSASYISDTGTGDLNIQGTNVALRESDGTYFFYGDSSTGVVSLRHNGVTKLATTATGVDVTGTVTADGLTVDGTDDANNLIVGHNNTNFAVYNDSTVGEIRLKAEDGSGSHFSKYMTFYTHPSGSAATERMRIDSSGNVGIGDSTPLDKVHIYESVNSATATQLLLQNEGAGSHAAGIAFQVSSSGETTGFAPKAGIVFERQLSNGGGTLKFFNDGVNDTNPFSAADEVMSINNAGTVTATAFVGDGSGLTGVGGSTSAGAVGTYGLFYIYDNASPRSFGYVQAGSSLYPVSVYGDTQASAQSGSWRLMGRINTNNVQGRSSVFVRIS